MNKCIKITIKDCNEIERRELNKILWDIRYKTKLACNKATAWLYTFAQENMDYKSINGTNINENERFGKSHISWIENRMNEIMEICNTGNVAQTRQFVANRFKDDTKKGLFKGKVPISSFKEDNPIIIHNKNYKLSQGNNGYEVKLSLFNREYQTENNIKMLTLYINTVGSSQKSTLNRIISGEYKQGSAQIIEDKNKKGKWYLTINFSFEPKKEENLNINKILGVDLGIVNTATMQIYDSIEQNWDWLNYKECMISGQELIHFRQKIEARKRQMQIASKCVGNGRIGHGKNTRMKPVYDIGDKESRFKDTFNHKVSKYIVDMAVKNNCGTIQMEDLSEFSEKQHERFLKSWTYSDLQTKVKYKAEEKGIIVNLVLPNYTSTRCNNCGHIDSLNRDCKKNQAKFECVKCGHGSNGKVNADINAARNIAIPNIEQIILEQLESQSKLDSKYEVMLTNYKKAINERDKKLKEKPKAINK